MKWYVYVTLAGITENISLVFDEATAMRFKEFILNGKDDEVFVTIDREDKFNAIMRKHIANIKMKRNEYK